MNRYKREGFRVLDSKRLDDLRLFGDVLETRAFWRFRRWWDDSDWMGPPNKTASAWLRYVKKNHPMKGEQA